MNPGRGLGLPSFSGLSSAVKEAREYENSKGMGRSGLGGGGGRGRSRQAGVSSETPLPTDGLERAKSSMVQGKAAFSHGSSSALLLQDTLTPLLDEVDALFDESKRIVASVKAQGTRLQDEDMEVEIMERMAEAWQAIEAKNARHDTSQKLNREKPMFCMDSLGKRIKAALLCKALPKSDNPAEYVNGPDNAPSRNLVTAIKLAGYVIHSGTGGKVSAVDGDGRKPPSNYTKDEFHKNVLPRVAENQPSRIMNELRQLSCRLVASGIAKGLLTEEDLPQIRRTLVSRFQDGGMHFLSGGDAAFARFIGVAANAHRLLERGDIDEFVLFHERVVKLVGMCRNRVRRAAYATSKNMLAQADSTGRYVVVKSGPGSSRRVAQHQNQQHPNQQLQQQQQQQQQHHQQQQQHQHQQQHQQHQHQQQHQQQAAAVAAAVVAAAAAGVVAGPAPTQLIQGQAWRNGEPSVAPTAARIPGIPSQASYEAPAPTYGKPVLDGGFSASPISNGNGNSIVRPAMSMLPIDNMPSQNVNHRTQVAIAPASDPTTFGTAPFHDHNALTQVSPDVFPRHNQVGYRRDPAYGPDGTWGNGAPRGQTEHIQRVDAASVLVLQPGWGVTLPPYFLSMADPKQPRNLPMKMMWELRAEALSGHPDEVLVEMRQVPGYLDFLAEIMPPDMLKFRWATRCWDTLLGKNESRHLLEKAAGALYRLGLVPLPPDSALRQVYDDLVSHTRNGEGITPYSVNNQRGKSSHGTPESTRSRPASHSDGHLRAGVGVPPVAAGVLRDLHREVALNGEIVTASNCWGKGTIVCSELQRSLGAPASAPAPASGAGGSTHDAPPGNGLEGANCSDPGTGSLMAGQWASPISPAGTTAGAPTGSVAATSPATGSTVAASTAVAAASTAAAAAARATDNEGRSSSGGVSGGSTGSGNGSIVGGKRKAGLVFTDPAMPEDDVDW